MPRSDRSFAAAGRNSDVRRPSDSEKREAEEHCRRYAEAAPDQFVPFRLRMVSGDVLDGYEHAAVDGRTACGIPSSEIFLMRHHLRPSADWACPQCADAVNAP